MIQLKTGYKNVFGYEDLFQFEFEKILNREGGLNWIFNWQLERLNGDKFSIDLKQSNRSLH